MTSNEAKEPKHKKPKKPRKTEIKLKKATLKNKRH